jgi:aerobic-type carbon monoxide dehydrogenase small subunit (CoxS/CutS family)
VFFSGNWFQCGICIPVQVRIFTNLLSSLNKTQNRNGEAE